MELKELVLQAQKGDETAKARLYEATCKRTYYLALKLLQNPEDAMDVMQDSYVAAFRALDSLQNPEAFLSWLAQITANRSKNLIRSRNKFAKMSVEDEEGEGFLENLEDPDEATLPEYVVEQEEIRRLLLKMIDDLPDEQRECVMLYYFSGLSTELVAQIQECSAGTVKSRLNYARKKLKESVLELEKRTDIHLHTLVPVSALFAKYAVDMPEGVDYTASWLVISGELAAGAVGIAGTTGAVTMANGAAASGLAKAGLMLGVKGKAVMGALIAAIAAAGVAVSVLRDPVLNFSSPQFETAFAKAAGLTVGNIHQSDVENIERLFFYEDNIYLDEQDFIEDESLFIKAMEDQNMQFPVDLTDLRLFPALKEVSLDFVSVENPQILAECDLDYLALVASEMKDWESINTISSLQDIYIVMPNVQQGVLDFSNFSNLESLSLVTIQANQWGTEFIGLEGLSQLRMLDGMCYEGASDLSFLSGMDSLEWCDLKMEHISDLTPISYAGRLRSLYLTGIEEGTDLAPLDDLEALECIGMNFNSDGYHAQSYWIVDGQETEAELALERHMQIYDEMWESEN